MPPALSDYGDSDCDSVFDFGFIYTPEVTDVIKKSPSPEFLSSVSSVVQLSVESQVVRRQSKRQFEEVCQDQHTEVIVTKRRRENLLVGLDLQNIIAAAEEETADQAPSSSKATSSHNTRASTSTRRRSQIRYNQKYHPMDDVIRPRQAAKLRATYASDSGSQETNFRGSYDSPTSSASEIVEPKRQVLTRPPTRRSARRYNPDVLYDMKVHPQDAIIEGMNEVGSGSSDIVDRRKKANAGEVVSHSGEPTEQLEVADSESGQDSEISESDNNHAGESDEDHVSDSENNSSLESEVESSDNEAESSFSPPIPATFTFAPWSDAPLGSPLSDITDIVHPHDPNAPPRRVPRSRPSRSPRTPSFQIFTESDAVQGAAIASGLGPLPYPHDDQENDDSILRGEPEPAMYIVVQTQEEYDAEQAREGHPSDLPSMFDGAVDNTHQLPFRGPLTRLR
ncbi:hypothetical protein P280DRAFT_513257 [Massarina eburnea CBS 473.64]|uniref:Uncharacterized protein n=1 Tax=Massarina eburnea CBS 473.64 TaxID=1395130 RepID=A0A6A6SBV8_9PLEO|nr:hypothetical protein P280DRAFT_513257 [Massarina eburnea CBS 473.64]